MPRQQIVAVHGKQCSANVHLILASGKHVFAGWPVLSLEAEIGQMIETILNHARYSAHVTRTPLYAIV